MRTPLGLVLAAVAMLCIAAIPQLIPPKSAAAPAPAKAPSCPPEPVTTVVEPLDVDELPKTEYTEKDVFPNREQKVLIGRLADGIYNWKTGNEKLPYFFCGEGHTGEAAKDLAIEAAWHIVRAAEAQGVNPWGVAGTALNEGQFDLCAFGLHPRLKSYELGILEPSKRSISHTRKDVLKAIANPNLDEHFHAYDLGMLQTLDIYYFADQCDRPRSEECKEIRKDLFTWKGFEWQVSHMKERSRWSRGAVERPWAFWPGHFSTKYDKKITRRARQLGAQPGEI